MVSEMGKIQTTRTAKGLKKYHVEVRHKGLGKYQLIRGDDPHIVKQKAQSQMIQWDSKWAAEQEKKQKAASLQKQKQQAANQIKAAKKEKEAKAALIAMKKEHAATQTADAQAEVTALKNILAHTQQVDAKIKWELLKDRSDYPVPPPKQPEIPREPQKDDGEYRVEYGFWDQFSSSKRSEKEQTAVLAFQAAHTRWEKEKQALMDQHATQFAAWKEDEKAFVASRDVTNAAIEEQKRDYFLRKDSQAIVDYCDLVLSNSQYPNYFPQSYELDYNLESKILVVDYQLPSLESIPTLLEVRYVQSRDEYTEKHISQTQLNQLYDNLLYEIALRTIHELFEADQIDVLTIVVFNGYVNSVDPATGQESNSCILSLQAGKAEFQQINLARIDPKICFKNLKGIGSSKLYSLTPIAPLLKINREDSRFVSSYDVAYSIQETDNLAVMDWEDFEHLIREIFEKEFAVTGGEVKVTQASRDGGVDAVVFDPDPLRGGKIIIQAKRYSNTVGVSAVRDLYGTLMNEGANKGILVTTSDYGPDAYEFAKGKPLVLLNGGNLLHLLEKHGHRARIDLKEAKQMMGK